MTYNRILKISKSAIQAEKGKKTSIEERSDTSFLIIFLIIKLVLTTTAKTSISFLINNKNQIDMVRFIATTKE